jgi:hypothetical protein
MNGFSVPRPTPTDDPNNPNYHQGSGAAPGPDPVAPNPFTGGTGGGITGVVSNMWFRVPKGRSTA